MHATVSSSVEVLPPTAGVIACMLCGWTCEPAFLLRCPRCGGALEPILSTVDPVVRDEDDPGRAYLDFLPIDAAERLAAGIMRRTVCRAVPRLGSAIGVPRLWVKDESGQPTGTTKDRMAALVVAVFDQFGIREFVASSTGNSATALARAVRRSGSMRAHFFCGRRFVDAHRFDPDSTVCLTVVDGDYAAASVRAQRFAAEQGICWEGGFFNWARREGLKLGFLEALDEMPCRPDLIVQAVSSGLGIVAAAKGMREYLAAGRIDGLPRFLLAQQDTCAPMVSAWQAGRAEMSADDIVVDPSGLASAILLGDARSSYPYVARIVGDHGGNIVAVSQGDLIECRRLLAELEDLAVCYSSAATVAAVRQEAAAGRIGADEVVLLHLTGGR
jgi:threonine synthase